MIGALARKFFGSANDRRIKGYQPRVDAINDRPIDEDILSGGRAGWPAILSSLKSVLENGKPLSIKMEPPVKMLEALKKMGIKVPG